MPAPRSDTRRAASRLGRWFLIAAVLLPLALSAQSTVPPPETLTERIAAVEESTELPEDVRTRLIELHRQTISNLNAVRQNEEAAAAFAEARARAPAEVEAIRARIERRAATDPLQGIGVTPSTSSERIARKVEEELANLSAVEAKLAFLDSRLEAELRRPTQVRQQIGAARTQIDALTGAGTATAAIVELPQVAEAARWASTSRLQALQSEVIALDQELLGYQARSELLAAERDEAAQNATRLRARIEALRTIGTERRTQETEEVLEQARSALEGEFADEQLIRELADANLLLIDRLRERANALVELAEKERTRPAQGEVDSAFRNARRKLELGDFGQPIGQSIVDERRHFPSARAYRVERRSAQRAVTTLGVQLVEEEEWRSRLSNIPGYVDQRIAAAGGDELADAARTELEGLANTRRDLLDRLLANGQILQRRLFDYDDALQRLQERTTAYDEFLAQHLFWTRSTRYLDLQALQRLPSELARYLRADAWLATGKQAVRGLLRIPLLPVLLVAALLLAWRRRDLKERIVAVGQNVGRVRHDKMGLTFKAIGYSLLRASPAPLALIAVGLGLGAAADSTVFANAVGSALVHTGVWLAFFTVLIVLFMSRGVVERHFRWPAESCFRIRRALNAFSLVGLPLFFVVRTSIAMDEPTTSGGTLTLLAFVALLAALVPLVVKLAHPRRGVAANALAGQEGTRRWRWRWIWFSLLLAVPLLLLVLSLSGYSYTSSRLALLLVETTWFLTGLWLAAELARRWLLLAQRRLAYEQTVAARKAAIAGRSQDGGEAEAVAEPDDDIGAGTVDLVAVDADSRRLLNAAAVVVGIIGLAGIWGEVFPAFSILERVQLWSKTALVEGAERLVPVTLRDILLALIISLGGYFIAKNLPSLINIALLKHGGVSAGARYTINTVTQYTVTVVAVIVVLRLLGANASQLGFAAAALGVGIGFGLQEIVANFICGLILLFERPVRVGDIITVGNASGVVSKIRIRATTLRDFEQKELVIPNKELITGRLLNWTLTDAVTRVQLTIGVAYGSDTAKAIELMKEAAEECPLVLAEPAPSAHFEQFADSTLNLVLRMFTGSTSDRLPARTDVNTRIDRKFKAAGIEIAFPQRDVHMHPAEPPSNTGPVDRDGN